MSRGPYTRVRETQRATRERGAIGRLRTRRKARVREGKQPKQDRSDRTRRHRAEGKERCGNDRGRTVDSIQRCALVVASQEEERLRIPVRQHTCRQEAIEDQGATGHVKQKDFSGGHDEGRRRRVRGSLHDSQRYTHSTTPKHEGVVHTAIPGRCRSRRSPRFRDKRPLGGGVGAGRDPESGRMPPG